jgi:hypothetical protein
MKSHLALALVLMMTLSSIAPSFAIQDTFSSLTNNDVVMMVKAKLPAALILEKINSSSCNFDTFPSVLTELKYKGVPDEVLMAMVKAPHGIRKPVTGERNSTGGENAPAPVYANFTIPDGTPLEIEATYTVSSADVEEGTPISFNVVHAVKVDGVTVIARGARATARITKAKKGGSWGRAGQLAWMMQDVVAVDGTKVPLEFSKSSKGDSKGGTVATGMVVTGLLFLPAAPLWGFKKGKDAKVPAGRRFDVSVHGASTVKAVSNAEGANVRQ